MRVSLALISAAMLMSGACAASRPAATTTVPDSESEPANAEPALGMSIERLAGPVWIHRSLFDTEDWGRVEANGLIVLGERGAVLVDTAWEPAQTRWLLDWIERTSGREAIAVVVTHSHGDRSAGIAEALARGIPVHGTRATADLLRARGEPAPSDVFTGDLEIDLGDIEVEAFHPGAGHAPDNSVVFVASEGLLFGGCLVRAAAAIDLGNLGDADLEAWPQTMRRVIERYDGARTVIPGHGAVGDATLLEHTLNLASRAR